MACLDKQRLMLEYDTATTRFTQAVREYRFALGTPAREQYELLKAVVEEARKACDLARCRLEAHDREHRCAFRVGTGAERRGAGLAASGEGREPKS
jgi:hypothetical protein